MKQLFSAVLAIAFFATAAVAQNTSLQAFIDRYKNDEAFTYAFLSKDLFEVAAKMEVQENDWKKLHNVVKNIGSLSVLVADSITDGTALYREALAAVPTEDFDELLTVRDGKDNVRIWIREEDRVVSDLVLLVGSTEDFVLICFAGNLELGNITELAALFDAADAEQLARTSEAVSIDFSVSPNPSSGELTIACDEQQDAPAFLAVIAADGRQVAQLRLSGIPLQRVILPELPSGLYWVQLTTAGGKVGIKQVQIVKN